MADLIVTAANVVKTSGSVQDGTADATITAGQAVYLKSSNNRWALAQCDGTAEEAGSVGVGIALNGASAGQPLKVQTSGAFNPGATATVGIIYTLSDNAGGIAPATDNGSGDRVTILGVGTTATEITLNTNVSGVVKP